MPRIDAVMVPVTTLKAHPMNPRKGNVDVIMDSLRTNGQYKSILVQAGTNVILAGTHTWMAAKRLGWAEVNVNYITVPDDQALQIVLVDNRAADGGQTDESAVFQMLATLSSLDGTGYSPEDLRVPPVDLDAYLPPEAPEEPGEAREEEPEAAPAAKVIPFTIGRHRGQLDEGAFNEWRADLPKKNTAAAAVVLDRLGLTEPAPAASELTTAAGLQTSTAPIDLLKPYPGNPRHGDIGRLMNSLQTHGQFRPIVANRRTMHILAGNNLTRAAANLGWTDIAVAWVDVDAEAERRIVIVDNRASDLAEYDPQALAAALGAVHSGSLETATGFTLEDLQDIIDGRGRTGRITPRAEALIQIGPVKAKVRAGLLDDLNLTSGYELMEAAAMLNLPYQMAA
jgi:ParB-like chromosome segregation protein Spo0J